MPASGRAGVREVFVGRTDLLEYLDCTLDEGQSLRADEVVGAVGMGKTSLLQRLFSQRRSPGGTQEWLVDLATYIPAPAPEAPSGESRDHAGRAYEALKTLARKLVKEICPDHKKKLANAITKADARIAAVEQAAVSASATIKAKGHAKVSGAPQRPVVDASAVEERRLAAVRGAGRAVAAALASCLNAADVPRPLVLLVDNVHLAAGTELATWIEHALQRLDAAVVVLAHEPHAGIDLPEAVVRRVPIPPLTVPEVADYLDKRRCNAPEEPELAELIHKCSGGVPSAVELLVDLLTDPSGQLCPDDLRTDLARLTGGPQGRVAHVVEEMIERLHGADLLSALRAVSITHQCDAPLLRRLMAEAGAQVQDPAEPMATLEAFSFTDEYWGPAPWGRAPGATAPAQAYYVSVHPFIAAGVTELLHRYDPDLLRRLHAVAADYCYEQLTSTELYGAKFLYEDPTYQLMVREWLCHLARSSSDKTRLQRIARIYFDAFWWFANYVHLEFCDQLVDDVQAFAREMGNASDVGFADALCAFHRHYPTREAHRRDFEPGVPIADWPLLRDALYSIQDSCQLNGAATGDEVSTVAFALSELYIAETLHHEPQGLERSLASYARADAAMASVEQTWDRAWLAFFRADTLLDFGRLDQAEEGCAASARLLAEVDDPAAPDEELAANLHRLRGDCAWHHGDRVGAMREYAWAALRAYLFHGVGGPPDAYTMQFYFEVRGRVMARLIALHQESAEQGAEGLTAMSEAIPADLDWPRPSLEDLLPALQAEKLPELAALLFPAGPSADELRVDGTDFMRRLRGITHEMKRATLPDLAR